MLLTSLLLLAGFSAAAQTPAFDVASIKRSDATAPVAVKISGYHIATTGTSLEFLIGWAYDMHADCILNRPSWLDNVRYDVVANGTAEARNVRPQPDQPTELMQMMQTLLVQRFKLVTHRENRQIPMYALVVAKAGHKLHLGEDTGASPQNPFSMPGAGHLTGTQVSTPMLAKALSHQLTRTVQDQTGLRGYFDFDLKWEPTDSTVIGASLFTALQEQLGLKVEARKGPVEVLIIDHIENAPSAN
jgi:uncharacterized protein (TIGR03435 family)